jgi:hypothetical protein
MSTSTPEPYFVSQTPEMPGRLFSQAATLYAVNEASSPEDACAQVAAKLMSDQQPCPPFLCAVPASAASAITLTPSISASAAQIPAPTAPELVATVNGTTVSLAWDAVLTEGQAVYSVTRGTTAGGPYELLGQQFNTVYTDSNLTNGTYYYVVTASNPNGMANSTEARATIVVTPS